MLEPMFAFHLIVAHFLLYALAAPGEEWEKSLDKDDIVIYTRQVDFSQFKEFRAEAVMTGTIDKFRNIMMDVDSYHSWMPDCKSVRVLEITNENVLTYHMKLKVPFPFANRDVIQQLVFIEEGDILEVQITNEPGKVEEQKNFIRMPIAQGKWLVRQLSEDSISIHFQYMADPGGEIPAWLVNSFIVKNPHATLKRIRKKMESD